MKLKTRVKSGDDQHLGGRRPGTGVVAAGLANGGRLHSGADSFPRQTRSQTDPRHPLGPRPRQHHAPSGPDPKWSEAWFSIIDILHG